MKTWIILGVVVLVGAAAYFYISGKPSSGSSLDATTQDATGAVGAQVLGLLNQIKSLKIDDTFFSNPVFDTLQDFTVSIPAQSVGRPNPFAPLPGSSASIATTTGKKPAGQ